MTVTKRADEPDLSPDDELADLFAAMRAERAPDDLERKLLGAVAVTGAATIVKSGFLSGLLARLPLLGAGGTALKTIAISSLVAGGFAVALAVATDRAVPTVPAAVSTPFPSRADRAAAGAHSSLAAPASAAPSPPSTVVETPAASAAPRDASSPPRDLEPGAPRRAASKGVDPVDAPLPANVTPEPVPSAVAAPIAADVLREEASRVRGVAAQVSAGRCDDARALARAYWAAFPNGQLGYEVRVLEARCPPSP